MLTGKWENPSHISARIGLLKPVTRTIAWQETLQRGEKTLEPPGAVSRVILHWHPSSEPKGLRSKSLGGLREAHALLLVFHMLFILCKFHIFLSQSWEGSFLQHQILKVVLILVCLGYLLFIFQAQIPGEQRQTRGSTLATHPYSDDPFDFSVLFLHA